MVGKVHKVLLTVVNVDDKTLTTEQLCLWLCVCVYDEKCTVMNVGHRTSQLHNTNATSDCIWLGSQAKTCKFYVTCCSFFSMMKPTYEFSWNKWTVKRRIYITKKRVGEWELWIKKWRKKANGKITMKQRSLRTLLFRYNVIKRERSGCMHDAATLVLLCF